jgi:hypothetical protein
VFCRRIVARGTLTFPLDCYQLMPLSSNNWPDPAIHAGCERRFEPPGGYWRPWAAECLPCLMRARCRPPRRTSRFRTRVRGAHPRAPAQIDRARPSPGKEYITQ